MDFEALRRTLSTRADTTTEQVSVNQRHLIDKILARYSAEFTVYREVLQNSNDAGASKMEVEFQSSKGSSKNISTVLLRNNGRTFSAADWKRLKSIAEGNPDEQKIGFFGVGFYSLFSICEEPMVISGDSCLTFYWEKDQLYTRTAKLDHEHLDDVDPTWTSIYLSLREPLEFPNMDNFAHFLAKGLLFTLALEEINVLVDKKLMVGISRRTSPEQPVEIAHSRTMPSGSFTVTDLQMSTIQLTLDKRYSSEPESKGFFEDLWRVARESLSKDSELFDVVRKPGKFNLFSKRFISKCSVSLQHKVSNELERITKKKSAKQIEIMTLYSSHAEFVTSDESEKVKHPVLNGVIPLPVTSKHLPTGKLFIGFETHQTTGVAVHCSGPFIPTVERESIDFVDSAVRVWNQECIGAVGLMLRAIWDYEINNLAFDKLDYSLAANHLIRSFPFSQTSPIPVIGQILSSHFLTLPHLHVPSTIGVSPVEDLRIIPRSMSGFLLNCPQPLNSDFNDFLAKISGVREAGVEELIRELSGRIFTDEQTVQAIQWCMSTKLPSILAHQLQDLLMVPVGEAGALKPLSHVKFRFPQIRCSWPLSPDCVSRSFTELLAASEWDALRIKPLPLSRWLRFHLDTVKFLAPDTCEDILIAVSNNNIDSTELAFCVSLLSNIKCIPDKGGKLLLPADTFLEDVLSFDTSLPTPSFKKRYLISDQFLKSLGVRSHLPTAELLALIESADWDSKRLIKYLAGIQDDLNTQEMARLHEAAVFQSDRNVRFRMCELHRDSKAARVLNVPVSTACDLQDDMQVKLLRKLGFQFYIPVDVLLGNLKAHPEPLYEYLFDHYDVYKAVMKNHKTVLCVDNTMQSSADCYTDPRSSQLGFLIVHPAILPSKAEHYLGVSKRPPGKLIVPKLTNVSADLTEFLCDCDWTDSDLYALHTIRFILAADGTMSTPKEVFFRVPDDFVAIFKTIHASVLEKPKVKHWLRGCGVQAEPSANELMLACAKNPQSFLAGLGPKKYAGLLRLFSVHLDDSISDAVFHQFKHSQGLLGVVQENHEAGLYLCRDVYVGDDAISQRQFGVPVAPSDLETFYSRIGCKRVSESVQSEWMAEGEAVKTAAADECAQLVRSRSQVIVKDGLKLAADQQPAAVTAVNNLQIVSVNRLSVAKRFNGAQKSFPTTACYDPKRHVVYITHTKPDSFDLAGCLVNVLTQFVAKSPVLSDTLLVSTLLSMPIESLHERGFLSGGGEIEDLNIRFRGNAPDADGAHVSPAEPERPEVTGEQSPPAYNPPPSNPDSHRPPATNRPPSKPKNKLLDKIMSVFGAAIKGTTAGASTSDMRSVLSDGIKASRPNNRSTIYKEHSKRAPPVSDVLQGVEAECAIASDLIFYGHISGFEFYTIPALKSAKVPEKALELSDDLKILASVFQLAPSSLHIFHDPASRSIAFNRGGALFFNAHFVPDERPLVFWYLTACHELAHNFCAGHDVHHEHYMMGYAELYLERLISHLY